MDLSVLKSFVVRFPDSNKSKTIIKISLCLSEFEQLNPQVAGTFIIYLKRENPKYKLINQLWWSCHSLFYNLETEAGLEAISEESPVCICY